MSNLTPQPFPAGRKQEAGSRKQETGDSLRHGSRSLVLSLIVAVALLLAIAAGPARAEPVGVVTGTLVQGTPDGPSVAGVEVRLFIFQDEQERGQRTGASDASGAFRFEGLETSGEYTYQVSALYAGLPYGSGGITFGADEKEKSVKVEVWDVTTENPGLIAESASFLLLGADAATESAFALEITELTNPGKKAYQPMPGGPGGPMNLVRFSLPLGATDLTPHMGMGEDEMFQVDRGVATTAIIIPGTKEFMYAYRFPYKDGKATFNKNLWYGAKSFTLLALENTGELSVPPTLTPGETVELRGQRFRQWRGQNIAPGAAIEIGFSKMPVLAGFRPPFRDAPVAGYSGMGVAAALTAVALLFVYQRRNTRRLAAADAGPAIPEGEIGAYLTALAELDDRFGAGRVPESDYQRQRDALKSDLKDLLRERDLQLAAPRAG